MKSISFPIQRGTAWQTYMPHPDADSPRPEHSTMVEVISGDLARLHTGKPDPIALIEDTMGGLVGWLTEHDLETALQHVRKLKVKA